MPTYNPVSYPLGAPSVSGSAITVETLLNEPTRITNYLSDISLRGFISPQIFNTGGSINGGAVIYDRLTLNDLFPTRDVATVAPGAEFPIVTSENGEPKVATPEKFGGKFFVTDEARDRNDSATIQREGRKLANAIIRKIDAKAISILDATVTEFTATQTVAGVNWSTVVTGGSSQSNASAWPAADFAKLQLLADTQELGVTFDLWVVNPAQLAQFRLVYGNGYRDVLDSYGIDIVSSNRVTAGTAYVVESGQVGDLRMEKPLSTETWREPETQRTWVQADCRPVAFVSNPYSIAKVTGLAG